MNDSSPSAEMPRYQSHKKVWALKIAAIDLTHDDFGGIAGATILPANDRYAPFQVDAAYVNKHKPQAGGYYVVYDDGYKSWSPADAFESGYSKIS